MTERELTPVGLTQDRRLLVLVDDAGHEFTVRADGRLRAALRGEHDRLAQLEITMDSALRPRDIQARIRSGETPETVAAAAQTTVEKIMGFATPVLAERAHIADRAQQASVRRSGQGPSRVLADAVAERLRGRNVEPDSVEWDAWRRDDGRWTLVADYLSGESARHAEFVFDSPGRYVVAEDDEARWLIGEQSPSHGPQPRAAGTGTRRLGVVGRPEPADQLPLGEDAIGMITHDADWIATQASERPVTDRVDPAPSTGDDSGADDYSLAELADVADADTAHDAGRPGSRSADDDVHYADTSSDDTPADSPVQAASEDHEPDQAQRRNGRRGRRASVPSWDEIMFGGSTRE